MTEDRSVSVKMPDGAIQEALIAPSSGCPWELTFSGLGMDREAFRGDTLFDAMIALRLHLEAIGYRLLCAGARRDVYPSGMARSMGGARKAYIFEAGKPATELIDIFSDALPHQVGTVEKQRAYNEGWFADFREKMR